MGVLNIRQLVRKIRNDCVKCLKQRDVTCGLQPGKAHLATVLRPSQHHTCIMIDLVPSLRLAAFKNQKTTRGAQRHTLHILISVCMTTKFSSFVLLTDKKEDDLALGLTTLCCKTGRFPSQIYCDRESGIVPLSRGGKWAHYSDGMYHVNDLVIKFCPALGSNHSNHGTAEALARAIKNSIVYGDVGKMKMDSVSFSNYLEHFFHQLNNVPMFSKIQSNQKICDSCTQVLGK